MVFSFPLVSVLHLTSTGWANNTDLNWLPTLEASFIHMANILGILPFRSWCVRKMITLILHSFPRCFFAKGNSCHCHSCELCAWQHLMSDPGMEFCVFFIFPSWQSGALTLGCRALQHHLADKCNPYEKLWQYINPRMHRFRFCFRL